MNLHVAQPVIQPSANGLTVEEMASLSFEPWTTGKDGRREDGMPTETDMTDSLTWLRIAWQLMFLSRQQMSARFDTFTADQTKEIVQGLQGVSNLMECMRHLAGGAHARVLCAVSAGAVARNGVDQ